MDFILGSSMKDHEIKEALGKVRREAVRAGEITRSLLDFVSSGSGSRMRVDLNEVMKKALSLAQGRIKEGSVQLEFHATETSLPVMADPVQMAHVFFHFVSNAINAMTGAFGGEPVQENEGRPRSLKIDTGKSNRDVYASFRDTGPGIAPEHLPRIFEPFFSTQNRVKEVGLGLAASYGIVRAHGGNIDVESVVGTGSEFTVTLPSA
jgi:C4-dicarboxylate-specific signal transduction histidine kinase